MMANSMINFIRLIIHGINSFRCFKCHCKVPLHGHSELTLTMKSGKRYRLPLCVNCAIQLINETAEHEEAFDEEVK
jgi:hypothetical protein